MKNTLVLGIIALFIITAVSPMVIGFKSDAVKSERDEFRDLTPYLVNMGNGNHPPIHIDGNDDFTLENGVTGGNGTENDPHIIEDWIIVDDGSASRGIFINNTDAYFVIWNCSVGYFSEMYDIGIRFNNVENGGIEDTRVYGNDDGIRVDKSTNINFNNCTCYENVGDEMSKWSSGIRCDNSSYITITSCESFDNQHAGVKLDDVQYGTIEDSVFYNNDFGIYLSGGLSVYNTIRNCKVFDNTIGIYLNAYDYDKHSSYHKILDCEIYDNGIPPPGALGGTSGISILILDDVTIENCTIYHNGRGINIWASSNNMIRNCKIFNHQFDISPAYDYGICIDGWFAWISKIRTFNNTITDCDIYDNEGGILLVRSVNTRVQENNIFNNSYKGLSVIFYSTARINWNNIYGNGFGNEEWGSGFWVQVSLIDARHNYWGADDGPKIYRLDRHANVYPIRDGHGDNIYRFWSILLLRPWATSPIPDAGRQ